VDTRKHHYPGTRLSVQTKPRALALSQPDRRIGDSNYGIPCGLPAVLLRPENQAGSLQEYAAKALSAANVADYSWHGTVRAEDGTELGTWLLVTSMAYLHGDYAEIQQQIGADRERRKAAAETENERRQLLCARKVNLLTQIQGLGIDLGHFNGPDSIRPYEPEDKLKLPLDAAEELIAMASNWKRRQGGS
jgi:hypothetical protein